MKEEFAAAAVYDRRIENETGARRPPLQKPV